MEKVFSSARFIFNPSTIPIPSKIASSWGRLPTRLFLACLIFVTLTSFLSASGIFRDGSSARSMALGGNNTAIGDDPLDAVMGNPATLSNLDRMALQAGVIAGFARGTFSNRVDDVTLSSGGIAPELAFSFPQGNLHFGLGIAPLAALQADWRYLDPPGGLDGLTSYGIQTHRSEILLWRAALAASYEFDPTFSAGISVGLLYNRNRLKAPYTLQSQPALRSAKVLLDLETAGFGWNVEAGMLWKPTDQVSVGVTYTTQSRIHTDGDATVDARLQLRNIGITPADDERHTDAEVTNTFPQIATLGAAWQITPKFLVVGQVDWINWADSFDTLEVRLSDSRSRDLNGLTGETQINDDAPLHWRDQWVWRTGAEFAVSEHWKLRAGYIYANNPVPSSTLTPLTAVITEHTVSAGLGYYRGPATLDFAWQWGLPNQEKVGLSGLAGGDYSQSRTEISAHWFGLTAGWEF